MWLFRSGLRCFYQYRQQSEKTRNVEGGAKEMKNEVGATLCGRPFFVTDLKREANKQPAYGEKQTYCMGSLPRELAHSA